MSRTFTVALAATILLIGCNCPQKEAEMSTPTQARDGDNGAARPAAAAPGLQVGWELAPRAEYSAQQSGGEVTIRAKGENPTAGFETKLVQSPQEIWPPQFLLARKRPDGIVAQVITPFDVSASFKAGDRVERVTIRDAAGSQQVPVEQR